MIDPRDSILQSACPTLMEPRFGSLEHLDEPCHRFLAAADGLWLELHRSWLHLIWPLCEQATVAMPYGELAKTMEFSFDTVPAELIQRFIGDAQADSPIECAAWLIWNDEKGKLEYRKLRTIKGTDDSLELERPALLPYEYLAVDLHSHGTIPAFFSTEDNLDDAVEVKISMVFGNVDTDSVTVKARLCALGLFIPL